MTLKYIIDQFVMNLVPCCTFPVSKENEKAIFLGCSHFKLQYLH